METKIKKLRELMKENGIQAYLVPSSDPHQNEYVPDFWQRRKYISDFTGSAGDVVIGQEKAGLRTDSRYFLQAEQQLDKDIVQLYKMGLPDVLKIEDWISKELKKGDTLGVDPQVITHKYFNSLKIQLEEKGFQLKCIAS